MKIISLNVWNGKQKDELCQFLENEIPTTDIFCLQETYDDFRATFGALFKDFNEIYTYRSGFREGESVEDYVLTTYVKKPLKILESKILFCEAKENSNVYGAGVDVSIESSGTVLHILNYHGVSRPKDKLDTSERVEQSSKITSYYQSITSPKILIGDFNFLPTTQSYETIKGTDYSERFSITEFQQRVMSFIGIGGA